jgi:hypothetical protein
VCALDAIAQAKHDCSERSQSPPHIDGGDKANASSAKFDTTGSIACGTAGELLTPT